MKEFDMTYKQYEREALLKAALRADATQDDLDRLGQWFAAYGWRYWNGERFDASFPDEPSGTRDLWKVSVPAAGYENCPLEDVEEWETIGYSFDRPDWDDPAAALLDNKRRAAELGAARSKERMKLK